MNNCYWEHVTTNELLYKCIVGEIICVRFCTENCHTEEPVMFKACQEKGFQPAKKIGLTMF